MAKRDKPGVATVPPTDDDSEKNAGKLGYKVLAGASAAIGTTVARKAIDTTWRKATGKEPPTNPEHPDIKWAEAATWAAASAAIVALVKLLAQRRVAATWRRASGELPPGLD